MRKELQELEDQILFMLSNSTGNILDDHKLIGILKINNNHMLRKNIYFLKSNYCANIFL